MSAKLRPLSPHIARSSLLLALTTTLGCATLELTPTGDHLTPEVRQCVDAKTPDAALCRTAFLESARRGDRRGAGQALLGLAYASPDKNALAAVALWLEPKPWLPASSPWTKPQLQDLVPKTSGDPKGAIVVFGASDRGIEGPTASVDVTLPASLDLAVLASIAHAAGADAAATNAKVIPAGHHFHTLTKVTPALPLEHAASARLVARAERAVLGGALTKGASLLFTALDGLEDTPKDCVAHAPIHASLAALAPLTRDNDVDEHAEAIREGCVDKDGAPPALAAYYRELIAWELDEDEDLTKTLGDPARRAVVEKALQERLPALTEPQRALVQALFARVVLAQVRSQEVCDDAGRKAQEEATDAMIEKTLAAGRPDLVLGWRARRSLLKDESIDPQALGAWLKEADAPKNRWLRGAMIEAALESAPRSLAPMARVGLAPVCRGYLQSLRAETQADRFDGAASRHAERIFSFMRHTRVCPVTLGPGRLLSDAVDATMAIEGRGQMPLVNFLGALFLKSAILALEGGSQDIFTVLQALTPKLQDVSKDLGASPDDKIVKALIDMITPASRMDIGGFRQALTGAIKTLSGVITDAPKTELERFAPALRLTFQVFESVVVGLTTPSSLPTQFASMHKTMEGDLKVMLETMEWDVSVAPALAHHLRAAQALVTAQLSPSAANLISLQGVLTKLDQHPGPRWWGVVFRSMQVGGWALHAQQASGLGDAVIRDRSIARSRAILGTLVETALVEFELGKTNWELLRLLVPGHELVTLLILDEGAAEVLLKKAMKTIVPKMEGVAQKILAETAQAGKGERPNFIDLLPKLLEASASIGFANMWDEAKGDIPQASREKMATKLEALGPEFTPELQVYLASLAGILRITYDKKRAMASFAKASQVAKTSTDPSFAYIPLLFSLRVQREGFSSAKATLALIDETLAKLEPTAQCGKRDGLDAMLPARAHLKAVLGDVAGADALFGAYLERVEQGFSGDARLNCSIDAVRGHVAANVRLTFPLGTFLSDTPESEDEDDDEDDGKSTFQVGVGFPSIPNVYEHIECKLETGPKALARIMQVRMMRALHLLRSGDDRGAQRALDGVLSMALRFANPQALGPEGQLWASQVERVDASLLAWVVTYARARGFAMLALRLEEVRVRLAKGAPPELPSALEEFKDYKALVPVVAALYPKGARVPDFKALRAALGQKSVQSALAPWSRELLWALANAGAGNLGDAKTALSKMPAPPKGSSLAMRDALALQLGIGASAKKVAQVFEGLLKEKMYAEAVALLLKFRAEYPGAQMAKMYVTALNEVPSGDIPTLRFELLSVVLTSMAGAIGEEGTERVMVDWLGEASGRAGLEERANRRLFLALQHVKRKEWAKAHAELETLTSLLTTQLPLNHPFVVDMLAIQASLAIADGRGAPVRALARVGGGVQGIRPFTRKALDALTKAGDDAEARKKAALAHLAEIL